MIFGVFSLRRVARDKKRDFHEMLGIPYVFLIFWGSEGNKILSFLVSGVIFSTSENRVDFSSIFEAKSAKSEVILAPFWA